MLKSRWSAILAFREWLAKSLGVIVCERRQGGGAGVGV